MLKEFREFVLRGNVVDLAVAVIIGTAFGAVVSALVTGIFTPLIAAIIGEPSFVGLTFDLNGTPILYGTFLDALFRFLSIAAVVFFFVVKPMNTFLALRKKDDATEEPAAPAEDVRLLTEIRDLLATRGNGAV